MARVPQAQRLVNENAPGFTPLQAADFSEGGRDIARAGFGFGRDVGDAANAMAAIKDAKDEATAKALSADFSKAARPIVEQYATLRGSQALDAREGVEKQLKTIFDGTIERSGGGVARGMLRPSLETEMLQYSSAIGRHHTAQQQAYEHDASIAYQTEKAQNAVLMADDELAFGQNMTAVDHAIGERGSKEGLPQSVIDGERQTARQNIHTGVITAKLAAGDVKGAQNWLTNNRAALGVGAIAIDKMIYPELIEMQANALVDSLRGTPDADAGMPVRNNNQGNIRFNPKINWQGQVGKDARGFVIFDKPENGLRALKLNLQSYVKNGFDTPLKIANRWAPKGDGDNDPVAYARTMAMTAGIGVNDKVPPAAMGRIASAIVQVENAAGSPSRGGKVGPKNAPGKPDTAAHLALIDQMDAPADVKKAAKAEVMRRDGLDRQLLAQREGDAYDAAVTRVNELEEGFTSVTQLGQAYLNASPQQQSTLKNLAEANKKGGAETDPVTYYRLLQEEGDDPAKFARRDLLDYADRLSWSDIKELGKRQNSALDKSGKPSPEAINRGRLFSVSKTAMVASDMKVDGKLNATEAKRRLKFIDAMAVEQKAWSANNPGKAPDDQTIRGWAGRLLTKFEGSPLFEVSDEDVAERMTPATRKKIEARLRAAGRVVNDATVYDYFRRIETDRGF